VIIKPWKCSGPVINPLPVAAQIDPRHATSKNTFWWWIAVVGSWNCKGRSNCAQISGTSLRKWGAGQRHRGEEEGQQAGAGEGQCMASFAFNTTRTSPQTDGRNGAVVRQRFPAFTPGSGPCMQSTACCRSAARPSRCRSRPVAFIAGYLVSGQPPPIRPPFSQTWHLWPLLPSVSRACVIKCV
jgi:hypothetical protein